MSLPPHRKLSPVPANDPTVDSDASHPAKRVRLASPTPSPVTKDMEMGAEDVLREIPVDTTGEPSAGASSSSAAPPPISSNLTKKGKSKSRKGKKNIHAAPEHCSNEDVIARDVSVLLGQDIVDGIVEEGKEWDAPFVKGERPEIEVEIKMMCSNGRYVVQFLVWFTLFLRNRTGEGLGIVPGETPWAILVPFSLPGEIVKARVYRHSRLHSLADLVAVVRPNPELRDESRVKCGYFAKCAGCQYQVYAIASIVGQGSDRVYRCSRTRSNSH